MAVFESAGQYIETATSIKDKIKKIDTVIASLLTTATTAAGKDEITEYQLNDGQTTIKTVYRGASAIMKSIRDFEELKEYYIGKLGGSRMVRLVDSKNFKGRSNGR